MPQSLLVSGIIFQYLNLVKRELCQLGDNLIPSQLLYLSSSLAHQVRKF